MDRAGSVEEPVRVVPYDPSWPGRFEEEAALLRPVLEPWLAGPIEHIGSTAVAGLAAKPVIDIMAAVRDLPSSLDAREALVGSRYRYFPYRPDVMHWFCKPSPRRRTHHLHLVPFESSLWRDRLTFRDALRGFGDLAAEYEDLKVALAAKHEFDREAYTRAKGAFVRRVLSDHGRRSGETDRSDEPPRRGDRPTSSSG